MHSVPRTPRAARILLGTGALLLAAAGLAAPAAAHDSLVSSNPADGATVSAAPASIRLVFDKPALAIGTEVRVTGPDGTVSEGRPRLVDSTLRQQLTDDRPAGAYTVTWRVTSSDGHPISGRFRFTASDAVTATASATPSAGDQSTSSGEVGQVGQDAPDDGQDGGATLWLLLGIPVVLVLAVGLGLAARRRSSRSGQA